MKFLDDLLHLIYPNLCIGCHGEAVNDDELFCIRCETKLPITDFHLVPVNEAVGRMSGGYPFIAGMSMFRFYPGGMIQNIIHEIKYKSQTNIARRLGRRYGHLVRQNALLKDLYGIIPIPLHPVKQRIRGYNQSKFFADGLSTTMEIPVLHNIIKRVENTETQTAKKRYERLKNMMSAFETSQKAQQMLENRHVLLVDDVLTTGATLESCALQLAKIPNLRLSFATIALAQ